MRSFALELLLRQAGATYGACQPPAPSGREVFSFSGQFPFLPHKALSAPKGTVMSTTDSTANNDRVIIFDTTLRDGEQSPGISLDQGEKVEIAEQLARLGVDVIEAGFPVASQGDFESVQAIAKSVRGPVICGLSRTALGDVDRCWEAIESAERHRIHVFIATSETHMKHKLRMTPDQVKAEAASGVARARSYTEDVEFSPEDASRSDFDFMCEVLQIAVDNGATTLNIPDTVGFAVPQEYAERLANVRKVVKGDYVISTHCHNDLGRAVATSLAAIVLTALFASLKNSANHFVDWKIAGVAGVAGAVVAWFAADALKHLSNRTLTVVFASVMITMGVRMLFAR
jgi:pyruvate carboxylase